MRRLSKLLSHLYVIVPVLDDDKHYWIGEDEVEKLLKHGGEWLSKHPERELIINRYLKYQKRLTRVALTRLIEEDQSDPDETETEHDREEERVEAPIGLNEQRIRRVIETLKECGAKRVIDLGCGEGRLLKRMFDEKSFEEITGVDVSHRALEVAASRLRLDRLTEKQRARVKLIHGSLTYRDKRLSGYDAATVIEVIEHLDINRLAEFERVLFEFARPRLVILTTPNVEYNLLFSGMPEGQLQHRDHRFEWTRKEFHQWANQVSESFGYSVRFLPIGQEDERLGPPTQMAVFTVEE